jgi:competence protein ComGG
MRNERGIMFPITVLLSCLFLLLVVHACALYEEELEFMKREEQSYDVDSLMQMAVHDLKTDLQGVAPDVSALRNTNGNGSIARK